MEERTKHRSGKWRRSWEWWPLLSFERKCFAWQNKQWSCHCLARNLNEQLYYGTTLHHLGRVTIMAAEWRRWRYCTYLSGKFIVQVTRLCSLYTAMTQNKHHRISPVNQTPCLSVDSLDCVTSIGLILLFCLLIYIVWFWDSWHRFEN